jgi:cytochrome c55X
MQRLIFGFIAAGMAALACASQASEPAAVDPPELIRLVRQDCGSCHGMTLQGGLGNPLTREALIGQSAEALAVIILHGKHGTAMPPWKTLLTEAQAQWIAQRLLEGFPEEMR